MGKRVLVYPPTSFVSENTEWTVMRLEFGQTALLRIESAAYIKLKMKILFILYI
jgi:hypothetical protein